MGYAESQAPSEPEPTDPGSSLDHLIAAYIHHQAYRGLSFSTLNSRRRTLTMVRHLLKRRGVQHAYQVRDSHLTDWVIWMKTATRLVGGRQRSRYAPTTIALHILQVREFFRWLSSRGVLLVDPSRRLTTAGLIVDPLPAGTIPTERQMRELFERLPQATLVQVRNAVIFELMYSSALRSGEVRALDVYDVDVGASTVRIRSGKGGKDRVVPVGRVARKALVLWLETMRPQLVAGATELACFVTQSGRRMGRRTLSIQLRLLRQRLTLPFCRLHDLRHACALHLLLGGADIRHIQELLGHARVQTSAVYTRLAPTDLKEAHRRCHPRERSKESAP